jgi:hypothetical protein
MNEWKFNGPGVFSVPACPDSIVLLTGDSLTYSLSHPFSGDEVTLGIAKVYSDTTNYFETRYSTAADPAHRFVADFRTGL